MLLIQYTRGRKQSDTPTLNSKMPAGKQMTEATTPKMGRYSAGWRRFLFRFFANTYFRRVVTTPDGNCAVYVSPGAQLNVLSPKGVRVDRCIRALSRAG